MKINNKFVIHNYSDKDDEYVFKHILTIIQAGKVSITSQGEQYCFVTTFKDGLVITCQRRRNTYTFKVMYE